MAIEEKVIQPESVTNAEQPVAETASQPTQPETTVDPVKLQYEEQIKALKKELKLPQTSFKLFIPSPTHNLARPILIWFAI